MLWAICTWSKNANEINNTQLEIGAKSSCTHLDKPTCITNEHRTFATAKPITHTQ